jgi:choline monooxygenase
VTDPKDRTPELAVDADIRRASTIPSRAYTDPELYARVLETAFARSWQWLGDLERLKAPPRALPVTLLEGSLDEPLLLTRDADDTLRALSNVCTHRGNLLVEGETTASVLRCRYHGRRFGLDGRCLSMPEFEQVVGFPAASDHLPRVPSETWGPWIFAALEPALSFDTWFAPVRERIAGLSPSLETARFDPARSRDYLVAANWALYVENYLEGFHIPYVHADLNQAIDYGNYTTELFPYGTLQLGAAASGTDALPDGNAAYYLWLWPNTMFNVYPWGVSINVVQPLGVSRTKIAFLTYVSDPSRIDRGAGAALDRVEREDEVIVEQVQRGVRSRLYDRGRYSPAREPGVHHFHRLLAEALRPA